VITNNGFDKARAAAAIEEGRADLVAFGKPFIGNDAALSRRAAQSYQRETFYGGGEQGYTDYPLLRVAAPRACYEDSERSWG
jgi:N-ethylmaleimide reductase